jgi:hypothetical protein
VFTCRQRRPESRRERREFFMTGGIATAAAAIAQARSY